MEVSPDGIVGKCAHCGNDVPKGLDSLSDRFCCSGCQMANSIMSRKGMDFYYEVGQGDINKVKTVDIDKYFVLDRDEYSSKIIKYSVGQNALATFTLPEIHCASCVWLLEKLWKMDEGIQKSEVLFNERKLRVHYNPEKISLSGLASLLAEIGYPPDLGTIFDEAPETNDRDLWIRLGIAGFCFGNIMLLSFPEYFNLLDKDFQKYFGLFNFLLSLPILLYCAQPYYSSALRGLKSRRLNMDVPISLGIIIIAIRSYLEIFSGTGAGFLDSLAGLVFFLLIGKYFQRKTFENISFDRDYRSWYPLSVIRDESEGEKHVSISQLKEGDIIKIRNGELVPSDSILQSEGGHFDLSFITGESDLIKKEKGEQVTGGARVSGETVRLEVKTEVVNSELTQLWASQSDKDEDSHFTEQSLKMAQVFTPLLLIVALIGGVTWVFIDSQRVWEVVSSVLIVACPCGIALSTPFSLGNAIRYLGRTGVFLKSPVIIESLSKLNRIFWDKTGTITTTGLGTKWEGMALSSHEMEMVYSLASQSIHPHSQAIVEFFSGINLHKVANYEEVTGLGISGEFEGTQVVIGARKYLEMKGLKGISEGFQENGSISLLAIDDKFHGTFFLDNPIRSGVLEAIRNLNERYEQSVLSGDSVKAIEKWEALVPPNIELLFGKSPKDKAEILEASKKKGSVTAMIGDGLNDSGALGHADVGISVTDNIAGFTPSSDIIISGDRLSNFPNILYFSKGVISIIKRSYIFSGLYNLIGVGFALSGNLSPLVAAILMPLSSVTIMIFTTVSTMILGKRYLKHD